MSTDVIAAVLTRRRRVAEIADVSRKNGNIVADGSRI
jgi:hypothetical protein